MLKASAYLITGLLVVFFLYGLSGVLTGYDILTGVKYDEMAGIAPMLYMLLALIALFIEFMIFLITKKKKK